MWCCHVNHTLPLVHTKKNLLKVWWQPSVEEGSQCSPYCPSAAWRERGPCSCSVVTAWCTGSPLVWEEAWLCAEWAEWFVCQLSFHSETERGNHFINSAWYRIKVLITFMKYLNTLQMQEVLTHNNKVFSHRASFHSILIWVSYITNPNSVSHCDSNETPFSTLILVESYITSTWILNWVN